MNCKQVESFLPLYAGHELDARRARQVESHLQACAACAAFAEQYDEARELLRSFTPPPFSEGLYEGMRRRVLREIEPESRAQIFSPSILSLLRPRVTWAVATALLIAVGVVALYIISLRRTVPDEVANKPPAIIQPSNGGHAAGSKDEKRIAPPSSMSTGDKVRRVAEISKPQRKKSREVVAGSANLVIGNTTALKSMPAASSPTLGPPHPPQVDSAASERTLRMEIQTRNPNIRIIWFSQPATKPALPNSRGI